MNKVLQIILLTLLITPLFSIAKCASVSAATLDEAEAKIAMIAQEQGTKYKILSANTNNRVHMTAALTDHN
ncbi:DUF1471 domain-containing protein [Enterobacter mori]